MPPESQNADYPLETARRKKTFSRNTMPGRFGRVVCAVKSRFDDPLSALTNNLFAQAATCLIIPFSSTPWDSIRYAWGFTMGRRPYWARFGSPLLLLAGGFLGVYQAAELTEGKGAATSSINETHVHDFVRQHCLDCHDDAEKTAGLSLEALSSVGIGRNAESWEHVVRRLRARQMPPIEMPRPDEETYDAVLASLEGELDRAAARRPNAGRTDTFRRLSRSEYQNAIRDLLELNVDVNALLPPDEAGHGFDSVASGVVSPTLLTRYISAAQNISRLAMGGAKRSPGTHTVRIRPDITQEEQLAELPLGTRGGALVSHTFPQDGLYDLEVRLMRDRNENVEGLTKTHQLEILLDRKRVELFTINPPKDDGEHATVDAHLKTRVSITGGAHKLGITFLKDPSSLLETNRQPFAAHFNMHRHPRITPAIYQITIVGPYDANGPGDTPSRSRILVCYPAVPDEDDACARRVLTTFMRRAYRRAVNNDDLKGPLQIYRKARREADFDGGIEAALSAVLVSPQFLFRIERDPPDIASGTAYRISDLELASRLSFFLWSSIPDDELLDIAIRGELGQPEMLERQVQRMLADDRSRSMITNFAGQWLHLRNLDSAAPDGRLFPDFDDNLRQSFRRETELLFESVLREDRSVLDLITADYVYLNERLAKHYAIPHIYGSRFRRVALDDDSQRGGLLRHGSILMVTSYATRTSPVIRGHWVMKNLLGMEPPPQPPNVPALKENNVSANLPIRQRLVQHRADPTCASCHDLMDPVGFALENFDAVGRWRDFEDGKPVDAAGGLPDGSEFSGVAGLEQALLKRREMFVSTMVERLLTFALARGIEYYDAPAIRKIVRDAEDDEYRFSSLVLGIVNSTPFQIRTSP